ncbi:MAG: 16S rRNA processing protein RimM, partial [Oscillospiraceae bacterium]|nr:16S rRNA processing protein RimM [Oscillospiraceae bacterium]MBQ6846899.1 16S rRNA processing protein RimM [Oscillospiraceae bacterium]
MEFIEAGKIVNTHSVYGELKVQPWSDEDDFLCDFDVVYIDERPFEVERARLHKNCVLLKLSGINNINEAQKYRNKCVCVDRDEVELDDGTYFIADLEGLTVIDKNGETLGKLVEVLTLPSSDVYVIKGEKEYMIPAVPEFIVDVDIEAGIMNVSTIPGMEVEKGGEKNAY